MDNYELHSTITEEKDFGPIDIKISTGNKINQSVSQVIKLLEANSKVTLFGKGNAINKTVTIVEIVKRKYQPPLQPSTSSSSEPQSQQYNKQSITMYSSSCLPFILKQSTEIDSIETIDTWKGKNQCELDDLQVKRNLPCILITLSI